MSHTLVTTYFEADHRRLDSLFRQFQALKQTDMGRAASLFDPFLRGLRRHIVWEEELLFPRFESKTGLSPAMGPTAVMRDEHRRIEAALARIRDRVRAGDPASDGDEAALLEVLAAHNQKEETILYPAIDQHLSEAEAAEVFAAMEAITAERDAPGSGAR
jgi:regulator of cell morphogenesis and NO signaling